MERKGRAAGMKRGNEQRKLKRTSIPAKAGISFSQQREFSAKRNIALFAFGECGCRRRDFRLCRNGRGGGNYSFPPPPFFAARRAAFNTPRNNSHFRRRRVGAINQMPQRARKRAPVPAPRKFNRRQKFAAMRRQSFGFLMRRPFFLESPAAARRRRKSNKARRNS